MYHLVRPNGPSLTAVCGELLGAGTHTGVYRSGLLGAAADGLPVCPTCVAEAKEDAA